MNAELHTAYIKVQALTLELAHHRRMRFGAKAEALSVEQRDLTQETWESDLAELEARIDVQGASNRPELTLEDGSAERLPWRR